MTARQTAFAYFVAQGWTPAQSAGVVANLEAESGLNPAAVGDGGAAYGIAQWHSDRQAGFAALMGEPIQGSSLEDQLAWVNAELNRTEKAAGDALRACTTAAEAGACVSLKYERPADAAGEANRRGALAVSILTAQINAGEPIADAKPVPSPQVAPSAPTPANQPESPMFAMLLPAILQLVPQLIGIFGKGGERAGQNQAAAQAVSDALTKAVPGAAGLADAVEKATNADAATQAQVQQAVVSDTSVKAMLDAVAPTLDKLAQYDAATNAAQILGADAAAARSVKDRWDMTRTIVLFAGGTSTVVVLGLLATILYQAISGDRKIDVALVGLAGPLLAIAMKVWGDVFAYRFDGTPTANAANAANQVIASAIPKQP